MYTCTMPRFVKIAQAAEFIGRTEKAVRGLVARRQIPFIRDGRTILFDLKALETHFTKKSVKTVEEAMRDAA